MQMSKSMVDNAGKVLANKTWKSEVEYEEKNAIFIDYRRAHLAPITEITLKLQEWLEKDFNHQYYIAQRLKRRPQILRKLLRFSVRLSQLQDIGGCRIIVENNEIVNNLVNFIHNKLVRSKYFTIKWEKDYRDDGRDVTGYRAYHIIVERSGHKLEIQIRTRLQHYWAEGIERVSILYGARLKEMEGDPAVLKYFKCTSEIFHKIELGFKPSLEERERIDTLQMKVEKIIEKADVYKILNSKVEDGFIRSMIERESKLRYKLNNWMLIFNWRTGRFTYWVLADRKSIEATEQYAHYEEQYTSEDGFEVVMIGSSDVSAIQHTHSHYFGIDNYDKILENIDDSLLSFKKQNQLNSSERIILAELYKRGYWGFKKVVSVDTLRNHYCKNVQDFKNALEHISKEGFVVFHQRKEAVSLNLKKKADIKSYM